MRFKPSRSSADREQSQNFEGVYSATSILTESNLHSRVLQTRLTPKLGALIPIICSELDYAMTRELPGFESALSHVLSKIRKRANFMSRRMGEHRGLWLDHPSRESRLVSTLSW